MKVAIKHFAWKMDERLRRRDAGIDWLAFALVLGLPPLVGGVVGYALCLWVHA